MLGANRAFYILLTIFTAGLFILFSLLSKIAPLAISHTIYFCQKALSNILFTLPHSFPSLLVLILLLVVMIGFSLLSAKLVKTLVFIKRVLKNKIATPEKVYKIASSLNIEKEIDVVNDHRFSSFCYGFMKPRICLSLNLIRLLSEQELTAVMIHESYHLKHKDPLKIILSEVATSMFFFIPTIKDIHNYYTLSKEVAADQLAIQQRYIKELRTTLTKALLNPTSTLGVALFADESNLEQRISILTNKQRLSIKISVVRLFISFFVFILALVALNMPVYAIEDGNDNHSYFVCPYGGECMLSCAQQGVMSEMPFSSRSSFTPINYSTNH